MYAQYAAKLFTDELLESFLMRARAWSKSNLLNCAHSVVRR